MKCPSPVRGRRAEYRLQHSDRKAISGARTRAGQRELGLGESQLLRRRRSMLAIALGAGALLSALGPLAERANAQGAGNSDHFLRPVLDGDPRNPPRFNNSRSSPRANNTSGFTPVPNYQYQPAIGAGTTGFDSTGAPRRPKGVQKGKPSGAAKAPPTDKVRHRRRPPSPPRQPSSFCRWRSPSQRCCCPIRRRGWRAARVTVDRAGAG